MGIIKAGVGGCGVEGLEIAGVSSRTGMDVMLAESPLETAWLGHARIRASLEMQGAKVRGKVVRLGEGPA